MPIVHPCATDGCNTLTMGELCLDCERLLVDAPVATRPPGIDQLDDLDEPVSPAGATA